MKTRITLLIALFISLSTFAQGLGMNYKAVIKDASGNLVTAPTINVRFTIQKSNGTGIYTETHTNTPVTNGVIIVNIGEGTTTDDFSTIDWPSDAYLLQTEIDLTGSYVIVGSAVPFKAVPYAKHAESAAVADNAISKIDQLNDAKSDDDGTNNGSSIFLGVDSGLTDDGTNNRNVGVGFETLKANTFGYNNVATGHLALKANTEGHSNIAIGANVLTINTTGYNNNATGSNALAANTEGYDNSASGIDALRQNTTGNFNVANGSNALQNNTTGSSNIALGASAGSQNVSGNNNIFIGNGTGSFTDQSDKLYIDNSSTSTPLIYGDFNSNFVSINGYLNIDTTTPNPLALTSSSADNYITFDTSSGYKGYSGIFNGDNDMDFGTGIGNTSGKVHLVTNTSPKLTVTSIGNVGIGTENPMQALDVVGKIKVTNDSATPTAGTIRFNESTNAFEGFIEGTGWVTLGKKVGAKTIVIPASQFIGVLQGVIKIRYFANTVLLSQDIGVPGTTGTADAYISAPLIIPVGSRVISISYIFEDDNPDRDLDFTFSKYCGDSTSETVALVNLHIVSGLQNPNLHRYTYALNETIEFGCQYNISAGSTNGWGNGGISTGVPGLKVHKVYITYQED